MGSETGPIATTPVRPAWNDPARRSFLRVLVIALVTRLIFVAVTYYAYRSGAPHMHPRASKEFGATSLMAGWLRWDTWWYVSIVEDGYSFSRGDASNVAFLPGYPVAMALLKPLLRQASLAGFVVSNLSFVAGVFVLWDWVRERASVAAAERAAIVLLLYPLSFFLNTAYAEAPFFLLCTLSLREADRGRWLAAGAFACLATLTRPMGLFLGVAFAWSYFRAFQVRRAPRFGLLAAFLPVAVLIVYVGYLWRAYGTPFALLDAHKAGWEVGKTFTLFQLPRRRFTDRALLDAFNILMPFVLAVLCARAWRGLGPVSGLYATLAAALGIFLGGESLGREVLAVVPAFAAAGLSAPSPGFSNVVRLSSLLLLVAFAHAFVRGIFMG